MKTDSILGVILLATLSAFFIFSYIPAMIDISAMENERMIFLQMDNKIKEVELVLNRGSYKPVMHNLTELKETKAIKAIKETAMALPQAEKKIKGNGGFLMKETKWR